jgi:ABC-type transport system substrate-binding protein
MEMRPVPGGTLRIAAQQPESLDPVLSKNYWESELVLQLFDSLLKFDSNLNIAPALAQDWEISGDGTTYTFHLRTDVHFHNGRSVTADDVVYSLTRLLDPKLNSDDAPSYLKIQGAADFLNGRSQSLAGLLALDARTLQIKLERPYAPFLRLLAQQPASIVPREEVERADKPFGRYPIGSGAFRLEKWHGGTEIVLSANANYYGGKPYLTQIHITLLPALNASESFQLFADGKLDFSFVPPDQVQTVRGRSDWTFLSRPILRLMYLGFNMRNPLLRDPSIREAVTGAINKSEVLGHDLDYSIVHSLIPFSLLGSDPTRHADPYDLLAARRALERQQRRKNNPVAIELWHARVSQSRNQLLSRLINNLNAAGFNVQLKLVESMSKLLENVYAGRTQLFLLGEQMDFPDPDALLNRLFHSKSPANPFGYSNPKVDTLLLAAQATLDDGQRAKLYAEIEDHILEDRPILPLSLVKYSFVYHRRVRGLDMTALGFQYLPLRGIWFRPLS